MVEEEKTVVVEEVMEAVGEVEEEVTEVVEEEEEGGIPRHMASIMALQKSRSLSTGKITRLWC